MYAFVCRDSACEALRTVSARDVLSASRWPSESRALPFADCVSNQADFKRLCREVDLGAYGVRSRPAHLLVPSQRRRSSGKGAVFHVWSSSLPAGSCLRMGEKVLLCGPEFTVIQLCGATAKLEGLLDGHVAAVRAEAGTLRELGIDEEKLQDTIDEYNEMCANGVDTKFHKPQKYLHPITGKGKYLVGKYYLAAYGTVGGVRINKYCEVLDKNHMPIEGLYSAGSDANTIYGDSYNFTLPGNTMGFAINSGRMAGESAAEYIRDCEE